MDANREPLNDEHSETALVETTGRLATLISPNLPPISISQITLTMPDLLSQPLRQSQFRIACHFFTHSNQPIHRTIPLPAHVDPNSGEAYLAITVFRQTERIRELTELFLLQDVLRNCSVPNAALILIFSYLDTDPWLERAYDPLEARSSVSNTHG